MENLFELYLFNIFIYIQFYITKYQSVLGKQREYACCIFILIREEN